MNKKRGIIKITPQLLVEGFLQLQGSKLVDIRYSSFDDCIEMLLDDERFPETEEGKKYPGIEPIYRQDITIKISGVKYWNGKEYITIIEST